MSFDELVFGETSYCFFRESAKATPRRVFLAFSPGERCDFLLAPRAPGALTDRAGILRAFSAYLSLFLGYPECEFSVRLGARAEPLRAPGAPLALYPAPPVYPCLSGEERIPCPDGSEILATGCASQAVYRFFFAAEPGRADLSLLSARLRIAL